MYAKRVLTIKAVTHSLLARLAHDPKQVLRSEVTGVLRSIDDETSKFNGLGSGLKIKCGVGRKLECGVGSELGSGLHTHGALLLHEDHEIGMLRKLEPCLFTQEELNRHQQREGTNSISQLQQQQQSYTIVDGIDTCSPGLHNENDNVVDENNTTNLNTHNDNDKPNGNHDYGLSCDMERVVRQVLTHPPEPHSVRALALSPSTNKPPSMFTLPSLNAGIPGLPAVQRSENKPTQ